MTYIGIPLVVVCAAEREVRTVLCDVNGPLRPPDWPGRDGLVGNETKTRAMCSEDHQRAATILV